MIFAYFQVLFPSGPAPISGTAKAGGLGRKFPLSRLFPREFCCITIRLNSQNQEFRVTDEAHPDKDGLFFLAIDYRITVHFYPPSLLNGWLFPREFSWIAVRLYYK